MVFDIGAGFSEAGKGIAQTAQAYGLEAQKADLEKEKVLLADQLAGQREEKQRGFQTSERVATQQFTGGENALNRTNAEKLANIAATAAVQSAGAHASATRYAADVGAESARLTREQNKPLIDAEALTKSITNTNAQLIQDARKEIAEARASGDPARIKAAQQKEYDASYSSQAQVQQVSLYQSQAKLIEGALTAAQARLVALQDPAKTLTPEGKTIATQMQRQVEELQRQYQIAVRTAEDALKNLPTYSPPGAAGAPDLSKYMRPPVGQQAPGLINSPASP